MALMGWMSMRGSNFRAYQPHVFQFFNVRCFTLANGTDLCAVEHTWR